MLFEFLIFSITKYIPLPIFLKIFATIIYSFFNYSFFNSTKYATNASFIDIRWNNIFHIQYTKGHTNIMNNIVIMLKFCMDSFVESVQPKKIIYAKIFSVEFIPPTRHIKFISLLHQIPHASCQILRPFLL